MILFFNLQKTGTGTQLWNVVYDLCDVYVVDMRDTTSTRDSLLLASSWKAERYRDIENHPLLTKVE